MTRIRLARRLRVAALCLLPLSAFARNADAQTVYKPVANWPARSPRIPRDYGAVMVVGVATDAQGRVYVFQRGPHPLLVFDRQGRFLRSWGRGEFTSPHGCRIDPQGHLWLTDVGDHRVMKFSTDGKLLATFGTRFRPGCDRTHFNQPADVAFAPSGDIYIADGYGNARIVRLSATGAYRGAWGRRGVKPGEFRLVHAVAVDARGRVYVADRSNARLQIFSPEGRFLTQWRTVGHPFGLFLTPDQRLFIADGIANTISVYDLTGRRLTRWGKTGSAPGAFRRAHALCVDDQGAVYVAEVHGKRVQKFVPAK